MTINGVTVEDALKKLQEALVANEENGSVTCEFSKAEIEVLKKIAKLGSGIVAVFSMFDMLKYWLVAFVVLYTQWGQIVTIIGGGN